jgi:CsoR family transcriptional regulator, copper-sensing transcriptional repressor
LQDHSDIKKRLNRIEGQVRGISRMVAEEKDCEKVMQQVAAVRAALHKVGVLYLENNLANCLQGEEEISPETIRKIRSFISSFSRFV